MRYRFYTCDVFTQTRFGGNPLAVIPAAEGLSTEQMQLIAREFNYSESTFVFAAEQGYTRHVRIFTGRTELPFAGHPNIGTAFTLATIGELGEIDDAAEIIFEEKAGLIPVTIRKKENEPLWCELRAPEAVTLGQFTSTESIAAALSLPRDAVVVSTHPPQEASVGLAFTIVELKDRSALGQARADVSALEKLQAEGLTPAIHAYVRSNDEFDLRARMFDPLGGMAEDPATGSANCALVGMLTHLAEADNGAFNWRIAQGVEMQRPSVLDARTEKQNGAVTGVWIGGCCIMISEGYLYIDQES